MLRYHMIVVTRDNGLKRAIKRLTTATGSSADFVAESGQINASRPIDLAIFDARTDQPDRRFLGPLAKGARILYIVPGDDLIQRLPLLDDERATSLFCHDDRFDDDEFISSATKALRGEVFGLQKYFPWGVTTFTMLVKNYEEKGRAIEIMMRYANMAGVRGPVRDRIQLVADELMMNALYHAPVDAQGREKYAGQSLKSLAQMAEVNPIQVQYGCSGRYFGLSVRDGAGSLSRKRALEYLIRAKHGTTIETKSSGAGLGLVSVLSSVSKLVFNLAPGSSTEAIGLFDMELFARGKVGARSLHLFVAPPSQPRAEDEAGDGEAEPDAPRAPSRASTWALVFLLGAGVAGLGTAYAMKRASAHATESAGAATLTVVPDPPSAHVLINGQEVTPGVAQTIPPSAARLDIAVSENGFEPWSKSVSVAELARGAKLFVNLAKAE